MYVNECLKHYVLAKITYQPFFCEENFIFFISYLFVNKVMLKISVKKDLSLT